MNINLDTYLTLDAVEMSSLLKNKEVSPKELLELSFKQLEKVNPTLNAITNLRKKTVFQEAKKINIEDGIFSGVPFLLKDTQAQKGEILTSGSKLFKENIPQQDAHLVAKFREAGLLLMGHTNIPEFALKNITEPKYYGPTRNPWNPEYSPGGSSGGSAAMIAAGVVPMAGASDGGGSIRIPASFSGLFGLKPTRGRTPVGPGVGRQWQGASIDFILSRSVRDSAAMLDILQVIQPEAAFQVPLYPDNYFNNLTNSFKKPLKIGFTTKSPVNTPVSAEAKIAVEKTAKWLEAQGHIVEEAENKVDGQQLMQDYFLMNSGEMTTTIEQLQKTFGRELTSKDIEIETWMLNEAGKAVTAAEFSKSLSSWDIAAAQMTDYHQTYDFYLTPTTANAAPKIGELTHAKEEQELLRERMLASPKNKKQALIYEMFLPSLTYTPFTQLANLTGQPAISVPVHVTKEGLPLGVQFSASKGEEHRLLQLAAQIEQSNLWIGLKGNPYFS